MSKPTPQSKSWSAWIEVFTGIFARRVHVENASILAAVWAGTGLTSAPDASLYTYGALGVSNNGDGTVDVNYNIYMSMPDGSGGAIWKVRTGVTLENILGA